MNRLRDWFTSDRWLPAVPLVIFPLLLVGPLLVQGKALFWGLPVLQFNPWRLYAWEVLSSGHLPLWNPLNGMGAPLMANYQLALWYPPSWPLYLFAALGGGPALAWAHTLLYMLHLIWAGYGTARLLRFLNVGKLGQTIAGLAFSLCGYMIARSGVFPMVWTASWLPWVILGASQISVPGQGLLQKRPFVPVLLVISTAMMLLAGHAQLSWYILLLAGAWVLAGAVRSGWRGVLTAVLCFGAAGLLAAALAAIQLIPTAEYLLQSQRSSAVNYELGMTYSFWPWRFLDLLTPTAFGSPGTGDYWGYAAYWEDAVYFGVLPMLLALSTLRFWGRKHGSENDATAWRRGFVRFLWVCIVAAFVLALGKNTPVFPFLYRYVPSFALFQAPTRFSILAIFGLCVLAGLGSERWSKPGGKQLKRLKNSVAAAAAVMLGAGAASLILENTRPTLTAAFTLLGALAFASGILALRMPPPGETARRARWIWLAAGLVGLDLLIAGWNLVPAVPAAVYSESSAAVESIRQQLGDGRIFLPEHDEYLIKFSRFFRFTNYHALEPWENLHPVLLPNMNLLETIHSANNFDPLVPGRWAQWMEHLESLPRAEQAPWLRLMGVSLVEERAIRLPGGVQFTPVTGSQRWYWADCATYASNAEDSIMRIANVLDRNHESMAGWVVLEGTGSETQECSSKGEITISRIEENNQQIRYQISTDRAGWLVMADTWYPGWQATVDGIATPVVLANQTFRATVVPAGQHMVVLTYAPRSFLAGWIISLSTGLLALIMLVRKQILRK